MQKEGLIMHKFDYSFLNRSQLNGNLINVLTSIYSMKSVDELRKGSFPNVYTELQKIAIVQSVKSSNAIENIITTDERINAIVNQHSEPLNHDEQEIAGYRDVLNQIHTGYENLSFNEENIIFDALYKTSEKIKTKGRGKGKFIYKYVLLDFKKYFDLWMAERERLGIDSEWLLVSKVTDKNGVHYEQAGITLLDSYAETCSRLLGIPFYFHSMRHNLVSRLSKYNIPSNIIVEFVGWSKEGGSAMIGIYDDNEAVDDFGKYFSADGIVKQEEKSLSDLK